MAGEDRIWLLAKDLLAEVVTGFAGHGVDLPERRYISDTPTPTADCELVAVSVAYSFPGQPGGELGATAKCVNPRAITAGVYIYRCVANMTEAGEAPAATAIESAAETILTDMWTLAAVVSEAARQGLWGGGCDSVFVGRSTMLAAQGGFGGVSLVTTAQIL